MLYQTISTGFRHTVQANAGLNAKLKLPLYCTHVLQGLPGHAPEEAQCLTILASFDAGNSQMPNQ